MSRSPAILLVLLLLGIGNPGRAQVTGTNTTIADAFLATGSAGNPDGSDLTGLNFGGAGTLAISPPSALKGEFQSVIRFNLSNTIALFNTNYGAGLWTITNISLRLTSNYGIAGVQPNNPIFNFISGGQFVIEWLADDDWVEGTGTPNLPTMDGVTYSSLPVLLAQTHVPLCTNNYVPSGNNVPVTWVLPLETNLLQNVAAGGDVNFRFYAADNQVGYLFNSYFYGRGNQPLILVTAILTPVPVKILAGYFTNSVFHLTAQGGSNLVYQVQVSYDLETTNWQSLGPVTADTNGLVQFDDAATAGHPERFYRLSR